VDWAQAALEMAAIVLAAAHLHQVIHSQDISNKRDCAVLALGVVVQHGISVSKFPDRPRRRKHFSGNVFLLAACIAVISPAHVCAAGAGSPKGSAREKATEQLSIQITDDRLTLAVTDVPQVYLKGVIDADAPQRFSAFMKSGKIPTGSDVYLNSSSGDIAAGLALGRLFRQGGMVTHLGTPRRKGEPNTATCIGACTYAYFGGLYRWAPTGLDRIGLPAYAATASAASHATQASNGANDVAPYLKEMGVNLAVLPSGAANSSHDGVTWLTADQMTASGLANNGRLPLTATYKPSRGAPYLVLDQVDRHGERRMTIECKPGTVTLTALNRVGTNRAKQIVSRGTRSYFEINRQETLTQLQQQSGANVVNESVTMTRAYPPARLEYIIFAQSVGAWVSDRNSAFRAGFTFDLEPVRSTLKDYYNACWQASPWPTKQAS
jgi:hypothetical protein